MVEEVRVMVEEVALGEVAVKRIPMNSRARHYILTRGYQNNWHLVVTHMMCHIPYRITNYILDRRNHNTHTLPVVQCMR